MAQRTGQVIGELVERRSVDNKMLWQVPDANFGTMLGRAAYSEQLRTVKRLEDDRIRGDNEFCLPQCAKVCTLSSDVWQGGERPPASLCPVMPTWVLVRVKAVHYQLYSASMMSVAS